MAQAPLIWLDLEMTGLSPARDVILEIATLVTDSELNVLGQGPALILAHSESALSGMDAWNVEHHTRSGLLQRVKESQITTMQAEQRTLEFVSQWAPPRIAPLCGNSVHVDKQFLYQHMPKLAAYLHYRIIDISTLKELAHRWRPDLPAFVKKTGHRALEDVYESIAELRYYRQHFLK